MCNFAKNKQTNKRLVMPIPPGIASTESKECNQEWKLGQEYNDYSVDSEEKDKLIETEHQRPVHKIKLSPQALAFPGGGLALHMRIIPSHTLLFSSY